MSKPWDKLRQQVERPPIGLGVWQSRGPDGIVTGPCVEIVSWAGGQAELCFGGGSPPHLVFQPSALRDLAEFCVELADQLEGG
jgi:hypothetical protein